MTTVYFAVGRCQHSRSCQAAAAFTQRASIVSPDFSTPAALEHWLSKLAEKSSGRRCKSCRRPIAITHFERRKRDTGAHQRLN